ncbi:MAG: AzlC family ABC transporter permease [Actinomycetota bacterium]
MSPVAPSTARSTDPVRLATIDVAPVVAALVPFALAIGAASAANGLSLAEAIVTPALLLAGASQLAAVDLVGAEAAIAVAAGTAIAINLRFALYSTALRRWFEGAPRWQQLLLAVPLIDQNFLLCEDRFDESTGLAWRRRYYLVVSGWMVVAFLAFQVVGYAAGAGLPAGLGLHLGAPLVFAGMLARAAAGRGQLVAAATAGGAVVLVSGLPGGLALPVAALLGVAVAAAMPGARR